MLVKGGHLAGPAFDLLLYQDRWFEYSSPRIETRHTHGTGCTYSAAITACLAKGQDLPDAVQTSQRVYPGSDPYKSWTRARQRPSESPGHSEL